MYKFVFAAALSVVGTWAAPQVTFPSQSTAATDPFRDLQRATDARSREQVLQAAFKEQQFVESFNHLAEALEEFARSYKATHSIDAKQVKTIREAYRKFEKADPWFKGE